MSRPSYVATAGGFCMAGSSRPSAPVDTAAEAAVTSIAANTKPAKPTLNSKPKAPASLK